MDQKSPLVLLKETTMASPELFQGPDIESLGVPEAITKMQERASNMENMFDGVGKWRFTVC